MSRKVEVSKELIDEFEILKDSCPTLHRAMNTIKEFESIIKYDENLFPELYSRYFLFHANNLEEISEREKEFVDIWYGNLEYEIKKDPLYRVQFVKDDEDTVLHYDIEYNEYIIGDFSQLDNVKSEFTKDEIELINPNYLPFMVLVEG